MNKYIDNLIKKGENQKLDFKFEISDSKKIARTLVAFANTDGGTLLVGVKDNGVIAGIRSEEEYYMIQAASELYCKPKISFTEKIWTVDGKTIMEINVPISRKLPHYAPDKNGNWKAWVRVNDQNLQVNDIILEVWKQKKSSKGILIKYSYSEEQIMACLKSNPDISLSKIYRITKLGRKKIKKILVNLISIGIIDYEIKENYTLFKLIPH